MTMQSGPLKVHSDEEVLDEFPEHSGLEARIQAATPRLSQPLRVFARSYIEAKNALV